MAHNGRVVLQHLLQTLSTRGAIFKLLTLRLTRTYVGYILGLGVQCNNYQSIQVREYECSTVDVTTAYK